MSCKSCQSYNQRVFKGEFGIHFPGLKGMEMPLVWAFPELEVCLDCGFTGFSLAESELRSLAQGDATAQADQGKPSRAGDA